MKILSDPVIKCNCCGCDMRIPIDLIDYDTFPIEESNMGMRQQHNFSFSGSCMQCNNAFYFMIIGYEYPVGAIEYQDSECKGCTFVYKPRVELDYFEFVVPEEYEQFAAENVAYLINQIKDDPSIIYGISSRKFEEIVAEVFQRAGYITELTPASNDGGKDVIAKRNVGGVHICLYIECKRYSPQDPVGVGIVKNAAATRSHDGVNKAIVITTSRFTRGARRFAEEEKHLIQLMDINDLLRMM